MLQFFSFSLQKRLNNYTDNITRFTIYDRKAYALSGAKFEQWKNKKVYVLEVSWQQHRISRGNVKRYSFH